MNDLTDHELNVLMTYARAGSYVRAARELGVSRFTLRNELTTIRQKLCVDSTIQALWMVTSGEAA